jgi:protein translocase SecG subunit
MTLIFVILIVIASIVLGLIVLIQNPKGGGLAGNIAGFSNQFMGVKQTTDVLEKGTWLFAGIIGCFVFFHQCSFHRLPAVPLLLKLANQLKLHRHKRSLSSNQFCRTLSGHDKKINYQNFNIRTPLSAGFLFILRPLFYYY